MLDRGLLRRGRCPRHRSLRRSALRRRSRLLQVGLRRLSGSLFGSPARRADAPVAPVSRGVSIQLGAFPSSDAAAAHWTRVKGQNQELLSDYSPRFIPVDIPGKGTLYRLRVTGFADKSAAKSVCDQIIAGGGACILAGK